MSHGRHFEKSKNRYISAAVSAISTKFGRVTQFGPRDRSVRYNLKFNDIQDGGSRLPKKLKLRYLGNSLTDQDIIWHDGAYWPSEPDQQLKFQT